MSAGLNYIILPGTLRANNYLWPVFLFYFSIFLFGFFKDPRNSKQWLVYEQVCAYSFKKDCREN